MFTSPAPEGPAVVGEHLGVTHPRVDAGRLGRGMTESSLQGQLPHPSFPHAGGVRVTQRVRRDPWRTDPRRAGGGANRRAKAG